MLLTPIEKPRLNTTGPDGTAPRPEERPHCPAEPAVANCGQLQTPENLRERVDTTVLG